MIITIDGPAGTGKSTVARALATRLGFIHFDTGAMYRSFTWRVLKEGIDPHDVDARQRLLRDFRFDIRLVDGRKCYFVGDTDVTDAIRSREVTAEVSTVAAIPEVRHELVAIQRQFGQSANAVFEGRDLGTVVFPKAELKIYLTASAQVRADRRFQELQDKSTDSRLSRDKILQDIAERDHLDSTREVSPLRQAEDACLIDTSELSIDEVVEAIVKCMEERRSQWDSSTI